VLRIPYALVTLRVNRFPILWLCARCKGIARFAALHLDTCSLRPEEVARISREEICRSRKRGKRFVPRTKLLRLLNKVSRPLILQDEILDRRWIRGLVLAQIRARSMISQQEPQ